MLLIIFVCWFYGNTQYVSISYFPFFHTLKANAENGAMQFVKGTHKNGFYGQVRSQKSGNVLSDNLEIDIRPEWKDKIIQTQLVSGQCSFHDGTVLKIALFRCTYMLCIPFYLINLSDLSMKLIYISISLFVLSIDLIANEGHVGECEGEM